MSAETERDVLLAGLRLVRSMPVNPARGRNGYDCAGCGVPLGDAHKDECPWERAMVVLRAHYSAGDSQGTNQ